LEPPWEVGVAPSEPPEGDSIVTLWASGAALVKTIDTVPAFPVSEVVVYFSCPAGLAARLSFSAPLALDVAGAGVELAVLGGAEDVVGLELVLLELLLDEPPQPASAATPTASASSVGMCFLGVPASLWDLMVDPPLVAPIDDEALPAVERPASPTRRIIAASRRDSMAPCPPHE
jgi:hypothetical protein